MDKEQHDIIIYSTPDGKTNVSLMTRDGKVWLNQSQISDLFGTSVPNICYHIANILKENEAEFLFFINHINTFKFFYIFINNCLIRKLF